MNRSLNYFLALFALLLLTIFSSCSTHSDAVSKSHTPPEIQTIVNSSQNLNLPLSNKREIIIQHAVGNLGRPYRWGGNSPKTGFDCSGLIFYTHQKASINTPRTARALYKNGKFIEKDSLNPADLVFFKHPNSGKAVHVGIYIGDGTFVHAPGKGRQVTYSQLSNPYFRRYYIGSRSFL